MWWQLQQDTNLGNLWKDTWKAAVLHALLCSLCLFSFLTSYLSVSPPSPPIHAEIALITTFPPIQSIFSHSPQIITLRHERRHWSRM